jgi:hypothetical protein
VEDGGGRHSLSLSLSLSLVVVSQDSSRSWVTPPSSSINTPLVPTPSGNDATLNGVIATRSISWVVFHGGSVFLNFFGFVKHHGSWLDPKEKILISVFFCQIKFYVLPQINFIKKQLFFLNEID